MNGGARVTVDGGGEPERTTDAPVAPFRAPALPGPAPSPRSDVANALASKNEIITRRP